MPAFRIMPDSAAAARIIESISSGDSLETAAAHGGIAPNTLRRWLRRGTHALAIADETGDMPGGDEALYVEFTRRFLTAEAGIKSSLLKCALHDSKDPGRAAIEILKLRWPLEWGDGALKGTVEALLDIVESEVDRDTYERVLARISGPEALGATAKTRGG